MREILFPLLALAIAFGFAVYHHKRLNKRWERLAKELRARSTPPEPPAQPSKWHAMPCGTRLELGDTGYWIELVGKKGEQPYRGYDPEGDCITTGFHLPKMKAALEEQAAYRDEFKPTKNNSYQRLTDGH